MGVARWATRRGLDSCNAKGQAMADKNETTKGRQMWETLEEAKENPPVAKDGEESKSRLYEVRSPLGEAAGYVWARSYDAAIATAARTAGFTASIAEPKGGAPLTKERAAAKLAELSDEELAELGLSRKRRK
jgi:hypothetical protein